MPAPKKDSIGGLLFEEGYELLFKGFQIWRISDFYQTLNKTKSKGRVLPFVRGLRLSALLIYKIRSVLESSGSKLDANWGHILDDDEKFCSAECDIIIHERGYHTKWNGNGSSSVMDFRFIHKSKAKVVISCKSFLTASVLKKEKEYCKELKKYVPRVWLFSECCDPKKATELKNKSRSYKFDKFWYAYTWDKKTDDIQENLDGWADFIKEIRAIS